jgi:hypothetical protein
MTAGPCILSTGHNELAAVPPKYSPERGRTVISKQPEKIQLAARLPNLIYGVLDGGTHGRAVAHNRDYRGRSYYVASYNMNGSQAAELTV